jgi:hypothetical protein
MSTTATAPTKLLGSAPEPFDGTPAKAEGFWSSLATYYYLNRRSFPADNDKIAAALTHFKIGTPAGEWARAKQEAALSATPEDFGTWDDFTKNFKAQFVPVETKMSSTNSMHTLRMGGRPFQEWYQEWSNHATRSGANEETKMYAFRQNLPLALHQKILGVSPAPTTLTRLVELAREFDQLYRMWSKGPPRGPRTRALELEEPDLESTEVNLANFPPGNRPKRLSQEERDKRRREGRCLYCGKPGHWQDKCPEKQKRRTPFQNSRQFPRTRTLQTENPEDHEEPAPDDSNPSISRLYIQDDNMFAPLNPDTQDF